jgi:hypothetical protein
MVWLVEAMGPAILVAAGAKMSRFSPLDALQHDQP